MSGKKPKDLEDPRDKVPSGSREVYRSSGVGSGRKFMGHEMTIN